MPAVALPRGGGALRGLGESFESRAPTGSASISVPVFLSPSRALTPTVTLAYDSGNGNGPFGLGWSARVPSIRRKTDRGIPRYGDDDVFVLADAEDLVPLLEQDGDAWVHRAIERTEHVVHRYRPRVEGAFARIERWVARSDGAVHWRTHSRDNVLSIFGAQAQARIVDPRHPERVFEWLLERVQDDRGNITLFSYAAEDLAGVTAATVYERDRLAADVAPANRYLSRIHYGNRVPGVADDFAFEAIVDYGELGHTEGDTLVISPVPERPWPVRTDPFSSHRAGFEVRTWRLCRRVLMFHHFPDELGAPLLVRSTDFEYDEAPEASRLRRVVQRGYDRLADTRYRVASLPALAFEYTPRQLGTDVRFVEAESLRDVPGPIDGARVRLVDLDGEGLPGLLIQQSSGLYYKRPEGGARFGPARVLPRQPSASGAPGWSLVDLDGDGRLGLAKLSGPSAGSFGRTGAVATAHDGWTAFRPFVSRPNFDPAAPNVFVLDATGDGLADVVVFEADRIVVYPSLGRDGFGEPVACGRPAGDERLGPRLLFGDATRAVLLADMGGDGLSDLVRIENGRVVYWPNLGHGRFGHRVEMGGAPWFDTPDRFRADRIRLGDVDGSGTADLLYFGRDGARVWINAAGNRYLDPVHIAGLPAFDGSAHVELADVLGSGCAALVWSSSLASFRGQHVAYVDLAPTGKPYLLRAIDNGMGLRRMLEYGTSTRAYLEDRAAGRPWVTRLPFVVHTLERIEVTDAITGHRFATRMRYRHGHFDGAEREFRGFAVVEQTDTESFVDGHADVALPSGHQIRDGALFVPPVLTRTRFHTGAWLDADAIAEQIAAEDYRGVPEDGSGVAPVRLPASVVPAGMSPGERREAMRALRGRALRQEVWVLAWQSDGTAARTDRHPFRVVESNWTVRMLQPRAGQRHASFFVHEREGLEQAYERDPADPRWAHRVTLAVDEVGSVTRTAAISYRRRGSPVDGAGQDRTMVTYAEHDVVHTRTDDVHRLGTPIASRTFEITGLAEGDPILSFAILDAQTLVAIEVAFESTAPAVGVHRRLLQASQQLYWSDDRSGPLALGQVGRRALPHQTRTRFASHGQIAEVFAGLLPAPGDGTGVLDTGGGFVAHDGAWWARGGHRVFDAAAFDLPVAAVDPFGNVHAIAYDPHRLFVASVTDPLGNVAAAVHDYRVLAPREVTDPNGNRQLALYDPMGLLAATVVMGKDGDHDGDTVAEPTTRFEYDLHAFALRGAPVTTRSFVRERHVSDDPDGPIRQSHTHHDGSGRVVQQKLQAAPGLAPRHLADGTLERSADGAVVLAATTTRWIGTGRTVVDNKGNPIKQYEPFFSDRPDYDPEDELAQTGVTPLLHYDPLGRLVRTDFPDGTIARVEIGAWQTTSFDRNDTVLQSRWFAARMVPGADVSDRRAAELTAEHADTSTTTHLDVLGRVTVTDARVVDDGVMRSLRSRSVLDVEGNVRTVIDARGNIAEARVFAMGQVALVVDAPDVGWRRALADVGGAPLRSWNARGFASRIEYDRLRRATSSFVTPPGESEFLAARTVWGEDLADAAAQNLRTRPYRVYDGAGELTHVAHDFAGNLRETRRRLARRYDGTVDWSAIAGIADPASIAAAADGSLEAEVFATTTQHDALGRVVSRVTPDGSESRPRYDEGGLLRAVDVRVRGAAQATGFVVDIEHDAKGQRLRCEHGNGTVTTYAYELDTFRLARQRLVRTSDDEVLQDLRYTYDPVGNVLEIRDGAQQAVYFDNAVVAADQRFEYDALYRLRAATGREHVALGQPNDLDVVFGAQPHPDDPAALRRYEQSYAWDDVGNLLQLRHAAGAGSYTRRYAFAAGGNRLVRTSAPGDVGDAMSLSYAHDAHGNMIAMPHLAAMDWDHADRLQRAELGGGGQVWFVYDGAGERVRKVRVNASGSAVQELIYLGDFELYRERAVGSETVARERQTLHVGDDRGRLCLVETLTIDDGEERLVAANVARYQHGNHLGSVALELDGDARVISYEEFHPFGTSSYAAGDAGVEVSAKRYRYIGKERDEETGLYHLGARYYASWLGRWTAGDPSGLADGVNRFAYCRGNPVSSRDASGHATESLTQVLVEEHAALHLDLMAAAMRGDDISSMVAQVQGVAAELTTETSGLRASPPARATATRRPSGGDSVGVEFPELHPLSGPLARALGVTPRAPNAGGAHGNGDWARPGRSGTPSLAEKAVGVAAGLEDPVNVPFNTQQAVRQGMQGNLGKALVHAIRGANGAAAWSTLLPRSVGVGTVGRSQGPPASATRGGAARSAARATDDVAGSEFVGEGLRMVDPPLSATEGGAAELSAARAELVGVLRAQEITLRVEGLLKPGGRFIGRPGSSAQIRELPGGLTDAQTLFDQLAAGGEIIAGSKFPGTLVKLPNGGTVGLRPVSTSGPPTIDVRVPGIGIREIKFTP